MNIASTNTDETAIIQNEAEVESSSSLLEFLKDWDIDYKRKTKELSLFNQSIIRKWNDKQKQLFVRLLYHQRGHFGDVLWYMGNFAPNAKAKEIILSNIRDEFGRNAPSHEQLYLDFAKCLGVDLTYELLEETYYLPFLREYNQGHLRWLRDHDWEHRLAAFAAIERLDNLDYTALRDVALCLDVENKGLIFFNVHIYVKHYEEAANLDFLTLWHENNSLVRNVFAFIGDYQIDIWRKLSDNINLC